MNLLSIAWKSLRQRALASSLTGLSVALGVMLMVVVILASAIIEETFSQRSIGYRLIVGPKGSDLQLVLSTVYRISPAIETLPYQFYLDMKNDRRVTECVPIALGDVTEEGAFPIVGTEPRYFELPYAPDQEFRVHGKQMAGSFDAIIGSRVAHDNQWDLGSTFKLIHGQADSEHIHDEEFTVVAILAPTGTPNDRSVFINLSGFFSIEGHDKPLSEVRSRWGKFYGEEALAQFDELTAEYAEELQAEQEAGGAHAGHQHHHETPDAIKEVSAMLVDTRTDEQAIFLSTELKRGYQAMAVNPIVPMRKLMTGLVGNVRTLLVVLTSLILAVSGVGIFVSIYNSMTDRRKEIAVMRALGASREKIFLIIVAEAVLLCSVGGLAGLALGHGLMLASASTIEAQTGLLIDPFRFELLELALFPVLVVMAIIVGIIPGMTAYRTDVARSLYS